MKVELSPELLALIEKHGRYFDQSCDESRVEGAAWLARLSHLQNCICDDLANLVAAQETA